MPYVYVPSSAYGGNNPPQVGGYTPARRLRTSRGGALTIAQEQERQRQVALAREKHLLEVEKVRAERAAIAKQRAESKTAKPAATEAPSVASIRLPSSEDQRLAREAGEGYRDTQGNLVDAAGGKSFTPRKGDEVSRPSAPAPVRRTPAAAPAPAPAAAPSVMPSAVYNPNENRNLLNVADYAEGLSRDGISAYLNAQNRAAINKQIQDAASPAFSAPTVADRSYDDVEQIRARSNVLADKPAALSASQIMRLVDPEEMDRTEARVAGRAAEMRDARERGLEGSRVLDIPRSAEPFRFSSEQQQALRYQPSSGGGYPHPLSLLGSKMASNAAGIGRSLGRAFSERFFPSYQPAEILPPSAMDPEVAALQQSQYINRLGDLVPASMRDPRSMYYFPGKFY